MPGTANCDQSFCSFYCMSHYFSGCKITVNCPILTRFLNLFCGYCNSKVNFTYYVLTPNLKGKMIKCTPVQALGLCTGRTAHRGSRGIALPFHDHGTRRGEGQRHAPAALYPKKDPVPIIQEAAWAPGPVWTGADNLATTEILSPDRPVRSQSIYRLSYPAHTNMKA